MALDFYLGNFMILSETNSSFALELMNSHRELSEVSDDELSVIGKPFFCAFRSRKARCQRPHLARAINSLSRGPGYIPFRES